MRRTRAFVCACAGLLLLLPGAHLGAKDAAAQGKGDRPVVRIDKSWAAPGLRADRLFSVAVLPVCRLAGDFETGHQIAAAWLRHNPHVGAIRLDDGECLTHLGATRRERDSILALVTKEIEKTGRPGPELARSLARRLGVTALVALRLDRWESRTGTRDMAYVDLSAALVDSSGNLLWHGVGSARAENPRPATHLPPDPVTVAPGASGYYRGSGSTGGSSGGSSSGGSSSTSSSGQSGGGSSTPSATSAGQTPVGSGSTSQAPAPTAAASQSTVKYPIGEMVRRDAPFEAALDTLLRAFAERMVPPATP